MFSNKNRGLKIFLLSGVILLGCLYGWHSRPECETWFQDGLADPEQFDGKEIVAFYKEVKFLTEDGFQLKDGKDEIPVTGQIPGVKEGDFISLTAIFHREGYLELKRFHIHYGRQLKQVVSLVPFLLILIFFFKQYRFDWKRKVFTQRNIALKINILG
ncbi:MAG: hypothetical protein QME81_11705 [bacterium]|nr:hypothetical protein [bacterium]